MSKFTKAVALLVLTLWGLAVMHCKLEVLPGLAFLQTCCFVDSAPSCEEDCESDRCEEVEDGNYRAEERTVSAPQPLLLLAMLTSVLEAPLPELPVASFVISESPPELPRIWQFSLRTAHSPRAPSSAS